MIDRQAQGALLSLAPSPVISLQPVFSSTAGLFAFGCGNQAPPSIGRPLWRSGFHTVKKQILKEELDETSALRPRGAGKARAAG